MYALQMRRLCCMLTFALRPSKPQKNAPRKSNTGTPVASEDGVSIALRPLSEADDDMLIDLDTTGSN